MHAGGVTKFVVTMLLLLPVFGGLLTLRHFLREATRAIRANLRDYSDSGALSALALAFGLVSYMLLGALVPTINYDDHAYHLRLWTELSTTGAYSFNASSQVWAHAPFASDLIYAIVAMVAGNDSRGAVNVALTLLIVSDLYRLTMISTAPPMLRATGIALFATTPLLLLSVSTLQTELFLAFLATRFGLAIARAMTRPAAESFAHFLVLAALLAATKSTGAILGSLLLALGAVTTRRRFSEVLPRQAAALAVIAAGCSVVALHSYVFAWVKTGNPVLPLFNAHFKSSYFPPVNFRNDTYAGNGSIGGFVDMFWRTSRYLESHDGVVGFQYLFLLPFVPIAAMLSSFRRGPWIGLAGVVVVSSTVLFWQQQYARYLFPVMPLTSAILVAAAASWASLDDRFVKPALLGSAALIALIGLTNLNRSGGVIWYLQGGLGRFLSAETRNAFVEQNVPEVKLNQIIAEANGPRAVVLYAPDRPYGATLRGDPVYVNWYNPTANAAALAVNRIQDIERFRDRFALTHVMWPTTDLDPRNPLNGGWTKVLAEYLSVFGQPLARTAGMEVFALGASAAKLAPVFDLASPQDVQRLTSRNGTPQAMPLVVDNGSGVYTFEVAVGALSLLRVDASFRCDRDGTFLVQFLWDTQGDPPHYRPVRCGAGKQVDFVDVVSVPRGASKATVFLASHGDEPIQVLNYRISGR
jgi:hypothetical protein